MLSQLQRKKERLINKSWLGKCLGSQKCFYTFGNKYANRGETAIGKKLRNRFSEQKKDSESGQKRTRNPNQTLLLLPHPKQFL